MATKKAEKAHPFFYCKSCDFTCCRKFDWSRHTKTIKHLATLATHSAQNAFYCICGKSYLDRTGLWRHRKKCTHTSDISHDNPSPSVVLELIKQNQEFKELLLEQNSKILELSYKNTNTINSNNTINNNKFNLNVFLNEKCKDAMNIGDFVNSLQLQIQDLENTGEYGFAEGISRIFMKGLKELDVYKRPIHCSDLKREIIHVKSENKWEKEGSERTQLKKAIKQIANKNICMIPEWKKANPGCDKYDSRKNDKYLKMVVESMGPTNEKDEEKDFNKIIRFVAKETMIEKDIINI